MLFKNRMRVTVPPFVSKLSILVALNRLEKVQSLGDFLDINFPKSLFHEDRFPQNFRRAAKPFNFGGEPRITLKFTLTKVSNLAAVLEFNGDRETFERVFSHDNAFTQFARAVIGHETDRLDRMNMVTVQRKTEATQSIYINIRARTVTKDSKRSTTYNPLDLKQRTYYWAPSDTMFALSGNLLKRFLSNSPAHRFLLNRRVPDKSFDTTDMKGRRDYEVLLHLFGHYPQAFPWETEAERRALSHLIEEYQAQIPANTPIIMPNGCFIRTSPSLEPFFSANASDRGGPSFTNPKVSTTGPQHG